MLLPMADLLKHAQAGQYGIPAVSATNELAFRAAVQAAEELHAPLIPICMAKANVDLDVYKRQVSTAWVQRWISRIRKSPLWKALPILKTSSNPLACRPA